VPFVRGLQYHPLSQDQLLTTAMLKDFVVYNLESCIPANSSECYGSDPAHKERLSYNAVVSAADLQQSFLPAFVAGIREGGARSAMTSYHALNGIPETAHPLIRQELREKLGWEGLMMSDGGAVSDIVNFQYLGLSMANNYTAAAAAALNSGVDLNSGGFMGTHTFNPAGNGSAHQPGCEGCPLNMSGYAYEHLSRALAEGMITTTQLRVAATRTLRLRFELGLFDPPESSPFAQLGSDALASTPHQQLAKSSAAAGLVLLRNHNATLPLPPPRHLKQLAVLGPNADSKGVLLSDYNGCGDDSMEGGDGGYSSCTLVTARQGLRAALDQHGGADVALAYAAGCTRTGTQKGEDATIAAAAATAAGSDAAVLVLGLMGAAGQQHKAGELEGEAHDRIDGIRLPGRQLALAKAVIAAQPRTAVVLVSGGVVSEPELSRIAPALVQCFYPGMVSNRCLLNRQKRPAQLTKPPRSTDKRAPRDRFWTERW
jgi:beta-glucosidase-like glycosyl hydrolase